MSKHEYQKKITNLKANKLIKSTNNLLIHKNHKKRMPWCINRISFPMNFAMDYQEQMQMLQTLALYIIIYKKLFLINHNQHMHKKTNSYF